MALWLFITWIILLAILLFTQSASDFLRHGHLQFAFTNAPQFSGFFHMYSFVDASFYFSIQKLGHFIAFFILAFLSTTVFRTIVGALFFCFFLAFSTELIQPFFNRDGRLLDILINVSGTMSYLFLYALFHKRKPINLPEVQSS
ncbi:VanZ family protein [Halalkalibacter alkaliphilus]|uniref:VanZ family protein n=1 Tax=Halalkalibacter alkaliphilus TaxID=2917993 RepID=A0A9X2CVL4_9BACI|nr:VanZ family protein [Halalkalibacter alkaliphilus]MCL7748955.1 VanZ family protein [Halalkalibacter alkaliphilus]